MPGVGMKADKQTRQRNGQACPGCGPVPQGLAGKRAPHEQHEQSDQEDANTLNGQTNVRIHLITTLSENLIEEVLWTVLGWGWRFRQLGAAGLKRIVAQLTRAKPDFLLRTP